MNKGKWKFLSLVLVLICVIGIQTTYADAAKYGALKDSKKTKTVAFIKATNYLLNYSNTTSYKGQSTRTKYNFKSAADLIGAANFIVENGYDAFHSTLSNKIKSELQHKGAFPSEPKTVDPLTVYKTISGDGTHNLLADGYGIAHFDNIASVEYLVKIGLNVRVVNGKIVYAGSPYFNAYSMPSYVTVSNIYLPTYYSSNSAGVTANYTVTARIEISIGNFSVEVRTESDQEDFAMIVNLR